jgi:hypothetical protein
LKEFGVFSLYAPGDMWHRKVKPVAGKQHIKQPKNLITVLRRSFQGEFTALWPLRLKSQTREGGNMLSGR